MTYDQAETFYISQIDLPHGKDFAASVGRFQEGFLADGVTRNLDEAFRRAVDAASRLLPSMQARQSLRAQVRAAAGLPA
jgi:hypothetical protein